MVKLISSIIVLFFLILPVNSEVIKEIKVINNDRISKETIQIFSSIKVGENYDQNDLNRILKEIYDTNFFSNVSLEIKDGVLIIDVEENKIIQNITVEGIKRKELVEDLKSRISSKDKNPFVENNIENDVLMIKKILKSAGFYFSEVSAKTIENSNNTIDLIFDLELGDKAFIKKIEFTMLSKKIFTYPTTIRLSQQKTRPIVIMLSVCLSQCLSAWLAIYMFI